MENKRRVVYNTGILYIKLILGLITGLLTTRIVLDSLGETNFGIYSLVAGIVGMLGFLNSSMSNASMRFMAHSLGTGDFKVSLKTFNTTLFLHFLVGLGVIVLMELGGLVMFKFFLNIPNENVFDAKVIFHFMVLTTFISIISVPYDAVINSHENILALSIVDAIGYIIRLGIALYLSKGSGNLLILYGLLMMITEFLLRILKQIYSKVKYDECKIKFNAYVDRKLIKTIMSFTGWNLLGSIASISVTQVRGLLLNIFFGVTINAADGISKTAVSHVNSVSASMTRALNPQLVKSEGSGNRNRMLHITELATKYSAYLFSLFAIPVIFEVHFLLNFWLKTVPEYTVIFCQLILLSFFIEKFTFEITSAIRAVGNIKMFQITETLLILLNIPFAYFLLKKGYSPVSIYAVNIFIAILNILIRLYFGKAIAEMDILSFMKNGLLPVLFPIIVACLTAFIITLCLKEGFLRFFVTSICSMSAMTLLLWFTGLRRNEKDGFKQMIPSLSPKFF